jgi:hypothetical protein
MATRRAIKGALHSFLGTFTSRYADLGGYWLFGFLVEDLEGVSINLLQAAAEDDTMPLSCAKRLAVQNFADQILKARLPRSYFREAMLDMSKSAEARLGFINGCSSLGHDVRFRARAITDSGKTYECSTTVFVAPHNPEVERKSTRMA